jgi:hypothetical protein
MAFIVMMRNKRDMNARLFADCHKSVFFRYRDELRTKEAESGERGY